MNEASANLPAFAPPPPPSSDESGPAGPKPGEGWSRNKIVFLVALAMVIHVALIVAFGTKRQFMPRAVSNVPRVQLADRANELLELDNPALFALPNPRDFSSSVWQRSPSVSAPSFRWQAAPGELPQPDPENLGAAFLRFMLTNRFGTFQLDFKPSPQFAELLPPINPALPQHSSLEISGELAQRTLLAHPDLPSLDWNDIIAPSRIQILVDHTGNVISAVLLPSDNAIEAAGRSSKGDTNAIALARNLKFAPAPQLAFGEITFYWHIIPLVSTNDASIKPEPSP